jgi:hypothetical protein
MAFLCEIAVNGGGGMGGPPGKVLVQTSSELHQSIARRKCCFSLKFTRAFSMQVMLI